MGSWHPTVDYMPQDLLQLDVITGLNSSQWNVRGVRSNLQEVSSMRETCSSFLFFSFLLSRMGTGWLDHNQQPWTMEWKPHIEEVEQSEKILYQFWVAHCQTPSAWERNKRLSCLSHGVLDIFFFLNLSQIWFYMIKFYVIIHIPKCI